ncbi:hypothetical protein [Nocardioides coralli]|uniref:hypothetical protein n=1 Tax=Nocardioides coralli TaxID=2872154 RepID=UPI001CA3DD19|nr:hypothetical protein [Nocardioides coralli]QZY29330.1 hypothetical protein K6T13_01035 [Nocardioides coralli]
MAGSDTIAVSIHGPAGVLDLVVPPGADAADVAREYAEQTSLATVPVLYTARGAEMRADQTMRQAGVATGAVLVAAAAAAPTVPPPARAGGRPAARVPGRLAAAGFWGAAALAALTGWLAAHTESPGARSTAVVLLAASATVSVLPVGRLADHRVLAAPAFAAAAAYAVVWDPVTERLPLVVGIAGVAAAATAAVGRALSAGPDEGLRVWVVAGGTVFGVALLAAVLGLGPAVVWSVLLVAAVLAARFVPLLVVDVPDHHLIDLERLAVTAWSARERPGGRRGRVVVRPAEVAAVAARAGRTLVATAVAIAVVAALAAHQTLQVATPLFDRVGARSLVFFAGAALLLTARSHRHGGARALLRVGGLGCWSALAWDLLPATDGGLLVAVLATTLALGVLLVVVAVATGRGWRSVWWSRRAEVAEGFAAAAALGSVVVSSGLFRTLWELAP